MGKQRRKFKTGFKQQIVQKVESGLLSVTADGMFGIFFGHTFIITEGEPECVDGYPWELTVVR